MEQILNQFINLHTKPTPSAHHFVRNFKHSINGLNKSTTRAPLEKHLSAIASAWPHIGVKREAAAEEELWAGSSLLKNERMEGERKKDDDDDEEENVFPKKSPMV